MRRAATGAAALALALGFWSPARALDEDVMRNILSPVFLAQNFIAVCARLNPDFSRETGGREGDAGRALGHIRDEILANMTREEAEPIVVSAAGAARAVGLGMIRALSGGPEEEQAERLSLLCEELGKPLVSGVVRNHEDRHDAFERILKDARQG